MSPRKKPRLSFQVEPEDQAAIEVVAAQYPGVPESVLLRAALRIGLPILLSDPGKVVAPPVKLEKPTKRRTP